MSSKTTPCQLCGQPMTLATRGRPRLYHDACGEIARALSRLTAALDAADEGADDGRKMALRRAVASEVATELAGRYNGVLARKRRSHGRTPRITPASIHRDYLANK